MMPARIHSRLRWKKPTASVISVQEASTDMMPRKKVSISSKRLRPSMAR